MSKPPPEVINLEDTPAARREDRLIAALTTIRDVWPHMLHVIAYPGQRIGRGSASTRITRDDNDAGDNDLPAWDRVVALRNDVVEVLNADCREIVDELHLTEVLTRRGGRTHPVNGKCALDLIAFMLTHARWYATSSGDPDYSVNELVALARRCHAVIVPIRREWMSLGSCPLEVEFDPERGPEVCGGQVRAIPQPGDDGDTWATCQKCGERAVIQWWESAMFDDPETKALMTSEDVAAFAHRHYQRTVKAATVRQWVARGILPAAEHKDHEGRSLYLREHVVWAMERWQRVG